MGGRRQAEYGRPKQRRGGRLIGSSGKRRWHAGSEVGMQGEGDEDATVCWRRCEARERCSYSVQGGQRLRTGYDTEKAWEGGGRGERRAIEPVAGVLLWMGGGRVRLDGQRGGKLNDPPSALCWRRDGRLHLDRTLI